MKSAIRSKNNKTTQHRRHRQAWLGVALLAIGWLSPGHLLTGEIVEPRVDGVAFSPASGFQFRIHGEPGEYPVETSVDLQNWEPWQSVRVYHQNIEVTVPESVGMDRRFFRVLGGERFETHHLLLSWLSLDAGENEAAFRMGLTNAEAIRIDAGEQVLEIFAESQFVGSVTTPERIEYFREQNRGVRAIPTVVSGGGIAMKVPGEEEEEETYPAWQFDFISMGTPAITAEVPDLMAGSAIALGQLRNGTVLSAEHVLGFTARKRRDAVLEELAGDWGVVRLEWIARDGELSHRSFSVPARITTDHGGALVSDGPTVAAGLAQPLDPANSPRQEFFGEMEDLFAFPLRVSPQGEIHLPIHPAGEEPPAEGVEMTFSGFMSPDANFLVLAAEIPGNDGTHPEEGEWGGPAEVVAQNLLVGVRRDKTPDLAGREYRLIGRHSFANRWDFEIGSWDDTSTIRFDSASAGMFHLADTWHWVPLANAGGQFIQSESEEMGNIPFDFGVGPGGRIEFDLSAVIDEEDEILLTGYAQEGGRILVFAMGTTEDRGGGQLEGEASLWIAICTNCD